MVQDRDLLAGIAGHREEEPHGRAHRGPEVELPRRLLLPDAVTPAQLAALRADMDAWTQQSREHAHNGALEVVSGSQRGPIHSLWRDGRYMGFIDEAIEHAARANAKLVTGEAGAVCLMHTRLLHGSAPNDSAHARTLFISVYSAEDAAPLPPNPMPHRREGLLVRGRRSGRVRATPFAVELPELLTGASFFEQQQAVGG